MTATVAADVGRMLERELIAFRREIELFPDDASLWKVVPGITNPAGTLALHVAGNLRHFIGAVLGGSRYVRDRDAEFSRRGLSRHEVTVELERAEDEIEPAILALTEAVLAAPYPVAVGGVTLPTGRFLIHLAVHTGFHLGQAGYLRRALTGDATSAGAIGLGVLG
ncbi:MAG TPA: DinB family protein [Gemmatimonadales bacterium]